MVVTSATPVASTRDGSWIKPFAERAAKAEERLSNLEALLASIGPGPKISKEANGPSPSGALSLRFPSANPPLAVLAAAKVNNIELKTVAEDQVAKDMPPRLSLPTGDELVGASTLLRYIGRISLKSGFYGASFLEAGQVDEWLEYLPVFSNGAEFERAAAYVDSYLSLRTFLVGYEMTIADLALWAMLVGAGPRWDSFRRSATKFPNLVRWFNSLVGTAPMLDQVSASYAPVKGRRPNPAVAGTAGVKGGKDGASSVTQRSTAAAADKQEGSFDVNLPDAKEGAVVTRFPPEPSGYMHIGHVKAALLNHHFATKYKGKLIIRFDDTNPSKEKDEYVDSILADLETLGIKADAITYTSDHFDKLQEMCERLIKEGKAYVDDTKQEDMRRERMDGINSKRRDASVAENLALWKEMIAATQRGLECCVRGKLDMQAPNKAMRDPVYYRCNLIPHHRTGSKYKVYPTYDFACPYVDALEGVTHALRSSEYHDRNEQYYRVLADMGLRKVHIWDFSRLNFVYTLLSKRKLQWFVDTGRVEGWDDPRFPTVRGVLRRGLTVETLKQFILSQGASKNLNLMELDKLWTINKKIIDPVCPRHTAVYANGKILLTLTNGPEEPFVKIIPRHKKYEPAGKKATVYTKRVWLDRADAAAIKDGEEITLMDWGNTIVRNIERDASGAVTGITADLHVEGDFKKTKLKLTWLAESDELVPLSLVELDYLITKKKLEEEDDFESVLNPKTKWEIPAVGDSNMRNLKKGEIIQLERKGYWICDAPYIRASKPLVLIGIPDGRDRPAPGQWLPAGADTL